MTPHALDIPFIFDNVRDHPLTAGKDSAIELADKVSDTIIEFARSGNPNVGKLPQWQITMKRRGPLWFGMKRACCSTIHWVRNDKSCSLY